MLIGYEQQLQTIANATAIINDGTATENEQKLAAAIEALTAIVKGIARDAHQASDESIRLRLQ